MTDIERPAERPLRMVRKTPDLRLAEVEQVRAEREAWRAEADAAWRVVHKTRIENERLREENERLRIVVAWFESDHGIDDDKLREFYALLSDRDGA